MSELELGRAARLLATALLAAFVAQVAAAIAQYGGDSILTPAVRFRVFYTASAVSPESVILLVAGLIVLAVRPDRTLLSVYAVTAAVACVLCVAGLVLLPTIDNGLARVQGWTIVGSFTGALVMAAVVAVLALRVRAGAVDDGPPRAWAN